MVYDKTKISSEKLKQIKVYIKDTGNYNFINKYILSLVKNNKNVNLRSYWSVVLKWVNKSKEMAK